MKNRNLPFFKQQIYNLTLLNGTCTYTHERVLNTMANVTHDMQYTTGCIKCRSNKVNRQIASQVTGSVIQ